MRAFARAHPELLARVGLALLVVVLFREPLLQGGVLYERDVHLIWHPQVEGFVRAVAGGALPLWDPSPAFGQPLLADPQAQVLFAGQYQNVMGEKAYADRLMPRIHEYEQSGHWTFLGNLNPVEMAAFYPNLNALVVPSLNSTEAFGLVQIEAMLNGVPCVASALPGVRMPVQMHHMGCVARIGDPASLAEGVIKVVSERAQYRGDIEAIRKAYEPDAIAAEYEKLFESLMHRGS